MKRYIGIKDEKALKAIKNYPLCGVQCKIRKLAQPRAGVAWTITCESMSDCPIIGINSHGNLIAWPRAHGIPADHMLSEHHARIEANAIQARCEAHTVSMMLAALKRAEAALNTAQRFPVPSLNTDSYEVASEVEKAIRRCADTFGGPPPSLEGRV